MQNHVILVGIAPIQKTAAASQPVTKPTSKAAFSSQKSQPAAQASKKATATAAATAVAPAQVENCLHATLMRWAVGTSKQVFSALCNLVLGIFPIVLDLTDRISRYAGAFSAVLKLSLLVLIVLAAFINAFHLDLCRLLQLRLSLVGLHPLYLQPNSRLFQSLTRHSSRTTPSLLSLDLGSRYKRQHQPASLRLMLPRHCQL